MNRVHGAVGRYFRRRAEARGAGQRRGPEAGASAGGAKFCGAGGGGCARLSSFRRALAARCPPRPARPHPGIRFPAGESRTTLSTFVLQLHFRSSIAYLGAP